MGDGAIEELLQRGLALQREGKPQEAEQLYRAALAREPEDADALHLMGLVCLSDGRIAESVELIGRAARIEPVTVPGCAFTSEQFAACLTVEAPNEFVCEYLGDHDLAKDYDRCPLYRLMRREVAV